MSLRVLHVLDHSIPLHSGYSFRTRAILDGQRTLGWETIHLTGPKQRSGALMEETVDGLTFLRTPPVEPRLPLPFADHRAVVAALRRRLDQVIVAERPDVVHAHSPALNGLAALKAARRHGVPFVYEVRAFWEDAAVDHGTTRQGSLRYRLTRGLETWVLRRADAVTCICEGLRADIVGRGVDPARVTVIPNAVDTHRFSYRAPRNAALAESLGLGDTPVVGFIGSFYGYEGLDLAIEALKRLRQSHSEIRLLLVGGGPQADNLRRQVREHGLEDGVIFTGRVPNEDVARYYTLVDAFLYPRRSMRLTELVTPLKPLEAMAQGIPVIASDIGGHRELIRHGETGLLFPAGDVDALADRVSDLIADDALAEHLRENGRAFVESERNWAASIGRYRGVYERLPGVAIGTLDHA